MNYPSSVKIVEVGPRDGLQNEKLCLTVQEKLWLIDALSQCGLRHIEAGSFVSPSKVPQMDNTDEVFLKLKHFEKPVYSALVPNTSGMKRAIACQVNEVAVIVSASEAFSKNNLNCSIAQSVERITQIASLATQFDIPLRGYVSCAVDCPYEGAVSPATVLVLCESLLAAGCKEISLGDTLGTATAIKTSRLLSQVLSRISADKLALHMHNTYGQALANVLVGLQHGIATFDSSVAGLGGCPFAKGATGNVATEDLVYLLNDMGIETGVNLSTLTLVGDKISKLLQRSNESKVGKAMIAKQRSH
ncbi:hydroxymethylglutaryl-CoA lyase [Agaribacter flavus]|uniref:Hydroxymethylglutaryl-CoA lyase n=1 Tax=Agaribacter flavus TaxID=1902781 RepID=A0ABV7FQX7_9ALTE